jgi:hypothetical protein
MNDTTALDRDVLYYPYIHIQDENWLKATLLCFPGVRRMVPPGYLPYDSSTVQEFCELMGPRNTPLLSSVNLFSESAKKAENRLLEKLKENDTFIRSKYSKAKTMKQFGNSGSEFRLHNEKIILGLYNYLTQGPEEEALAWIADPPEDRPQRLGGGAWLALHPDLGEALLTVKAVALANDYGLDIVTDSSLAHEVVLTRDETEVFDALIGCASQNAAPCADATVDDLMELVMTANFDVSALTPRQIADLLADGKDLRRFKNALIPIAATIPPIRNAEERQKRLKDAVGEVIAEWEKYKKSLPKFAVDAIFDSTEIKWPDLATSIALGTGGKAWGGGAGFGLGVAVISYAGVKIWREYKKRVSSPYGYLSKIFKVTSKTQSFLSLPPKSWS